MGLVDIGINLLKERRQKEISNINNHLALLLACFLWHPCAFLSPILQARKLRQEQLSNLPKVTETACASQDLNPGVWLLSLLVLSLLLCCRVRKDRQTGKDTERG